MTTLKPFWRKPSENIVEKGENADKQQFLLLPQCFLTYERQISFVTLILLSANTFNLDKAKNFASLKVD